MPIEPNVAVVVKERADGSQEHRLEIDPSPPGAVVGALIGAFFGPVGAIAGVILGGIFGPKASAPVTKDVTPAPQPQAESQGS